MKKTISVMLSTALCAGAMLGTFTNAEISHAEERTGFVYTNGTQFMLDGSSFYYAGTNNYYLNFKSKYAVDNVIEDAAAMGLKVIRTWGGLDVGVKTDEVDVSGVPVFTNSVDGGGQKDGVYYQYFDKEKNRPVVNEGKDGLQVLDYAIYKASQEDIKLLITFTNNWEAFGGKAQYVRWAEEAGITIDNTGITKPEDAFYTDETIKQWYKDYIETLLNHENVYTGIKYKDDPTIFSWELMNEPRCPSDENGTKGIFKDWATEMSAFVKSVDSNHMLTSGEEGFYCYDRQERTDLPSGQWMYFGTEGVDWNTTMQIPDIDFGTVHIYCDQWGLTEPEDADRWFKEHMQGAIDVNKPVIIEEFGWAEKDTRADKYEDWFSIFEGVKYDGLEVAGTNYWMIASEMDDNKLYPDYDGYTVYYRGEAGGANSTQEACDVIIAHAERMNSKNSLNSISPKKTNFDIIHPEDITLHVTMLKGTISGVAVDGITLDETNYQITDNTIVINADYLAGLELGIHKIIIHTTEGNEPTVVLEIQDSNIEKENARIIDNFENYTDNDEIASAYIANASGAPVSVSLSSEVVLNGNYAMKYDYDVESDSYCGVTKKLSDANWSDFDGISFQIYSDGSDRETTIQFVDGAGAYWESIQKVTSGTGWTEVKIPFSDFHLQSWGTQAESITKENIKEISIYAGTNGNAGKGTWYFDDIVLYSEGNTVIPAPTVTKDSAEYILESNDSVLFTINTNGNQFLSLTDASGNALVQGDDFAVNGSQYRINNSYLETLSAGSHTLTANFSNDNAITLTIIVKDSASVGTVLAGDVYIDGEIDILDVILINKAILGKEILTSEQTANADVDKDNTITPNDSLAIMKYIVKLISSFD